MKMKLINMIMISMTMTIILMTLTLTTKKSRQKNNTTTSSFECGFDQKMSSLIPFSNQFFMIALLFLIFDLEIIMFIPMINMENKEMNSLMISSMMMMMLILITMVEWKKGMIEWTK